MEPSDDAAIRACLDHHPEAYRLLVQRYQNPLACYLSRRLPNREEAVEAAQETFVRAYFALKNLRNREAFFSWLLGIADRVVKEMVRAAQRRRTVDCQDLELAAPQEPSPSDRDAALVEAVARLPDPYREVIVLRYYGQRSCEEISHDLGVPLGTVTKRLSRAYALLRDRLRGRHPFGEHEVPHEM